MATKPNKDALIKLFGEEFWDNKGKHLTYSSNIQAVKTRQKGDELISDIDNPYSIEKALLEPLDDTSEWWRPYVFDGVRWTILYRKIPEHISEAHSQDAHSRVTLEICDLIAEYTASASEEVDDELMKQIVLLCRERMDCPPVSETDASKLKNAKSYMDDAIREVTTNPWLALYFAYEAGHSERSRYSTESISHHNRTGMSNALKALDKSKTFTPRDKAVVEIWEEYPNLGKEDMMDELIKRGVYEPTGDDYRLVGKERSVSLNSFGDYLTRLKKKLNIR